MWARQALTPSSTVAAASTNIHPLLTGFQTAYGADPIGATVRRIRGYLSLRGGPAGNSLRCTVGIGVFNGNTAIASQAPLTNPHLDWMFWQTFFVEPVLPAEFAQAMMSPIDVKAMRRMEELGQDLVMLIQNNHPTDTLAYAYSTSTLLALP